ncbi:RILP-like protein 1 isoform X2 [Babylonia areolata]|uniref:RILP-like protein 1 isoform X2 n=1 Tax=Babylonia areolata TaxID=304850 RepID=UPI003FD1FAE7
MDSRRCLFSSNQIMDTETIQDVTVTDVYDQAAVIAREFDKVINSYGNEAVTELMPKVIRALEQLESLASRFEKDNEEIAQLRSTVQKLESEKAGKAQERAKFEQELEVIEENWQSEVKDLLSVVSKLQEENKRLKESLQDEKHAVEEKVSAKYRESEEQEIKVLNKLKETVDKQREELRTVKRELSQRAVDCEALQAQLEQIAKVNGDLRRKNNTHKKQAKVLQEERAELEIALRDKDREVDKVKAMISEQEKFEEQRAAVRAAIAQQRKSEEEEDVEVAEDGGGTAAAPTLATETGVGGGPLSDDDATSESISSPTSPGLELEGKMIIDLKDPNRPRFTLQELRQVLMERNQLKTRLIEVEDELNHYRPRDSGEEEEEGGHDEKYNYLGEELPVYGPINKEPEEKVFGPKESGIRKLFLTLMETGLDLFVDDDSSEARAPRRKPRAQSLSLTTIRQSRQIPRHGGGRLGTRERESAL